MSKRHITLTQNGVKVDNYKISSVAAVIVQKHFRQENIDYLNNDKLGYVVKRAGSVMKEFKLPGGERKNRLIKTS